MDIPFWPFLFYVIVSVARQFQSAYSFLSAIASFLAMT